MNTDEFLDYDDLAEAIRDGRPLRTARRYRVRFALDDLAFRTLHVSHAMPTGGQILEADNLVPDETYSLFAILPMGEFEEVLLDVPFHLRERGAERFVAFRTDRLFKLSLNHRQVQWGRPEIPGAALYDLGHAGEGDGVFLVARDGSRRLVEPDDLVDLAAPGIEHFLTAPRMFDIVVNARPRTVMTRRVTFEEIVQFAFPGAHPSQVIYSMTFRHVASNPHAGELASGGVVEVKNGSVFNVTRTVQS
jgi:hypothetical protein